MDTMSRSEAINKILEIEKKYHGACLSTSIELMRYSNDELSSLIYSYDSSVIELHTK